MLTAIPASALARVLAAPVGAPGFRRRSKRSRSSFNFNAPWESPVAKRGRPNPVSPSSSSLIVARESLLCYASLQCDVICRSLSIILTFISSPVASAAPVASRTSAGSSNGRPSAKALLKSSAL